ncbi:unnamed protein product [Arabidopsis halleri]
MFPNISVDTIINHPFYCSGTVALAEELVDPIIMERLTRLNHFLVNMRWDFNGGVIQAGYIRNLQRELDQTPAELLGDKLNLIFFRESLNLSTSVNNWYLQNLGVPGPVNFLQEYEEKCYSNYMKRKNCCNKCVKGMLEGAKSIGAGAATIASAGAAIGIGNVFSSLIHSVARNPSLAKQSFGYAILGFALTEAIALFAPMMAFLILFVLVGRASPRKCPLIKLGIRTLYRSNGSNRLYRRKIRAPGSAHSQGLDSMSKHHQQMWSPWNEAAHQWAKGMGDLSAALEKESASGCFAALEEGD